VCPTLAWPGADRIEVLPPCRAEALGAPQFPTLKHEMAVSPTAVACAAAAARPDHSWILAAVDAELDAERRHPPPAVSQSSAASRKRLHFA